MSAVGMINSVAVGPNEFKNAFSEFKG